MTETNEEVTVDTTKDGEEGNEAEAETITVTKKDYDKLNQDYGSLKRDFKDLKKNTEKPKEETSTNQKPDEKLLQRMEKLAFKQAGLDHSDDIELARTTAKKWGMDIEDVLVDDDFKVKLEKQQTARANVQATSSVKGSGGNSSSAKNTSEYWQAKGQPPTPADVPDKATRQKIVRSMMNNAKGDGKMKFYND